MTFKYTSPAELYARRYRDGERLQVGPALMQTGDPLQPTTDGVVIRTGRGGQTVLMCITTEHAHELCELLANHLNEETP